MQSTRFDTFDALLQNLCSDLTAFIEAAVRERGGAALALAGGSTPQPLYRALAAAPLSWPWVTLTLTDERQVPTQHLDSNQRMLEQTLLQPIAASQPMSPGPRFLPWVDVDGQPRQSLGADLQAMLPFDLVVLGMGADGHTASLFPDTLGYFDMMELDSGKPCWKVDTYMAKHPRLTLSLAAILQARRVVVLWQGADKLPAYRRALVEACRDAQPHDLPISYVLRQPHVEVFYCFEEDSQDH